jgi:hypothetical protein
MKERLITLACALGALALFVVLFINPGGGVDARGNVARPTTEELRGNGYHAAYSWLMASGLRTVSQRERFDALIARRDLAATGNVLVVTLPRKEFFRSGETRALQKWLRAGNMVLVLAALADEPDWAQGPGAVNVGDLKDLAGLDFEMVPGREQRSQKDVALLPNRAHAYFKGVGGAVAASGHSQQEWTVRMPYESFMLVLGHERDSGKAVLWTRALGEGRIVVCGLGSLFTDKALGLSDNAQLLANIIGANLGHRGAVIFDDFHQGLSAAYDPEKFYADPRLYVTGAILLTLWFIWVLGATRLRFPVTRIAAPREADLVRANGGFLARVLSRDVAARGLLEHFLRRVHRRMPAGRVAQGPWEFLGACPRVAAADLLQLRRWDAQARAGRHVPLLRLYNLILRIDRQIA